MVDELYLGVVVYVAPRYATLSPLYRAVGNSWQPVREAAHDFPNRGYVGWYEPPESVGKGSLWQFSLAESSSYRKDNPKHDRFYVTRQPAPQPPREVLDWYEDTLALLDDTRQTLTEQGIEIRFIPPPALYLLLSDNLLAGPVRLELKGENMYLARAGQDECLRGYDVAASQVSKLTIQDSVRHFLQPHAIIPSVPSRIFDWSSNETVVKRVLRWLRHKDAAYADSISLTEKVLDHAARLMRYEHDGDGAKLRQHQLQRALSLVKTVADNWEMAESLTNDLLALPVVVNQFRAAREREKERVRDRLADQTTRLDALREEEAQLKAERDEQVCLAEERLAQLTDELEQNRTALAQQAQESRVALETAMTQQLAAVMQRPEQTLAQIAIVRAALRPTANNHALAPQTEAVCLPWDGWDVAPRWSGDMASLRQHLAQVFAAHCYSPFVARTLHAAWQARLMPLLTGAAAYEALADYAACVAGGRLLWLPVGPQTLEPEDLLGRYEHPLGRFAPSPHGLTELLRRAVGTDELYVVVLEGLNRAPVDAYLMPLLALYADAEQPPERRRTWPLTPGGERLAWPSNVLLAGIWAEGASALPPSAAFWADVAVLWAEQTAETDAMQQASAPHRANLSGSVWCTEEPAPKQRDEARAALADWLTGNAFGSWRRAVRLTDFYASLRAWGATPDEARRDVALSCLAPDWLAKGVADDLPASLSAVVEAQESAARWRVLRWLLA